MGGSKGSSSRGPTGFGASGGRGPGSHQRTGTGRSTRVLGLSGAGGGAVAGAAEAAVNMNLMQHMNDKVSNIPCRSYSISEDDWRHSRG